MLWRIDPIDDDAELSELKPVYFLFLHIMTLDNALTIRQVFYNRPSYLMQYPIG